MDGLVDVDGVLELLLLSCSDFPADAAVPSEEDLFPTADLLLPLLRSLFRSRSYPSYLFSFAAAKRAALSPLGSAFAGLFLAFLY